MKGLEQIRKQQVEEGRAKSTIRMKTETKPEKAGEGTFDAGLKKGKEESLVMIRTISQDLTAAEKKSDSLQKEVSKLNKVIKKYEKTIEEFKKKSIERVMEVERVVSTSGVVGENMRKLKGGYTLWDLISACCFTAVTLVCAMLCGSGDGGRTVLLSAVFGGLIILIGSLGLLGMRASPLTE